MFTLHDTKADYDGVTYFLVFFSKLDHVICTMLRYYDKISTQSVPVSFSSLNRFWKVIKIVNNFVKIAFHEDLMTLKCEILTE